MLKLIIWDLDDTLWAGTLADGEAVRLHANRAELIRAFNARGVMSHSLDEPIPGAPALDASQALKTSVNRLLAAMDAFAGFNGTLRPHFAYGELTKPQYERAHLMHLANHWTQFQSKTATA